MGCPWLCAAGLLLIVWSMSSVGADAWAAEPGARGLRAVEHDRVKQRGVDLTAGPYYAWANRATGAMTVWMDER